LESRVTRGAQPEVHRKNRTSGVDGQGYLILKRATTSRPSGEWSDDDFDVLANGEVVGRIFKANRCGPSNAAPQPTATLRRAGRITSASCAVLEFPRIEPPLGLNQGNQQPFISTAFGSPSEVRYVSSGP
jgi:hypothetical protein